MNITKHIGIFFPWSTGIGTLGVKLGRFYCDLFWSDWSLLLNDDSEMTIRSLIEGRRFLLPVGIYLRMPWFQVKGRIVGGGQYYLWLRRFWRGFKRRG